VVRGVANGMKNLRDDGAATGCELRNRIPGCDGAVLPHGFLFLSSVRPLSGVLHQLGAGVMLPQRCSASCSEPGEHVEAVSQRPRWTVGVCGDELSAVVLVVGGGAPDP